MAELNLPNIREGGDIRFRIGLEDGGVAVDWSGLEDIRVFLYADAQKLVSGEMCEVAVDEEDNTVLKCKYSGDDVQYRGINSVLVRAKYLGEIKVYDKPAINIVARTSDATGVVEIDDPVVPVQISVEDVSTSLLNNAIDAAINAAAEAEKAAHLVPLQVLEDCVEATGKALEAASKAPYIDETTGNWFVWDAEAGEYVDSGKTARGATGNGIASWSVVESSEDAGNNVVTVTFTDGTSESFNVKNGHTGNGIASIVQTVESPDDAGTNVITITMTNGTVVTFNVKNGSKGTPGVAQAAYKSVDTLPTASAQTMDKIYLTPSGTSGVYNMSYTEFDGSAYSWEDLGTTAIQLSDYATKAELSQLEAKVIEKKPGENLFDKATAKTGYIINSSGNEEANASYNASDFIPVVAGETYADASESGVPFRFVNFYDSNKAHTSTRVSDQHTFTVPSGASYVRITFYTGNSYNNYAMVAKSSTRIPFVAYNPIAGYEAAQIADNIVSTSKVQNKAITLEKLGDDVIAEIEGAGSLENIQDHNSTNLVNPADILPGYWNTGYVSSDSYKYVHLDISELQAGSTLACLNSTGAAKLMRFCQFYNGNTYKSGVSDVNNTTIPSDVDNVYITFYVGAFIDGDNASVGVFNSATPTWEAYAKYSEALWTTKPKKDQALARLADINVKNISDVPSKNLMNPADVQVGYWNTGYVNNSSYRYFKLDLSGITAGTTLSALRSTGASATMRFCQFYRGATLVENKASVASAVVPNNVDSAYISFEYPTYFPNSEIGNCGVFNSASPTWSKYEEYTKALWTDRPSDPQALARIADLSGGADPVLNGKKWCPLGDSFTEGVMNTTLSDGPYAGEKKVYPYFIGNRTGINVVDTFFAGGRTLAFPATPGDFTNSICNPSAACYYQNIPVDVDYITIYLGINDSHHAPGSGGGDGEDNTGEIPIGTIDDAVTSTYYGAWNVVLSWLIENRPFAHIGIIVSNGCDTADYRTAQIAVARKYGIPFIDLNGDDRTPFMIRSTNTNIPSGIRTKRTQVQAVDYPSNTHPNDDAHEFESVFIENFLRTI